MVILLQPSYRELPWLRNMTFFQTVSAQKEEQRHVKHVDEVVQPRRTACMANDHQCDTNGFGYVDDVTFFLSHDILRIYFL